jgi:site-specific recombinase XerD
MRRESVATLRVRNLNLRWGVRNVPVKGGKTRDIPLPGAVMKHLDRYVTAHLPTEVEDIKPDTPLFWSTFGQRHHGLVRRPMEGKNVWRLCKTYYGRLIGYPMLKPHDLRHGVAMEVYEPHGDLEQVRGLSRPHPHRDDAALRADPADRPQAGGTVTRRRRSTS